MSDNEKKLSAEDCTQKISDRIQKFSSLKFFGGENFF